MQPRRAAPSSPAATARCPTHRWTHDRCRQRSPSGRTVRAYAAIGRRRHGPLCCRRANGALRFVLTIDYGPSLPPTEIITRGLIDPILTRRGASERLPRAENRFPCMGLFVSRSSPARQIFCPSSVSLFDLKARFFVPTHGSLTSSRAGAVKVGRRANLAA